MGSHILRIIVLTFLLGLLGCSDTTSSGTQPGDNNTGPTENNETPINNDVAGDPCDSDNDCNGRVCQDGICEAAAVNNTPMNNVNNVNNQGPDVCEGVGECGNCDPRCRRTGSGVGTGNDFNPGSDDEYGDSILVDEDGAITVGGRSVETNYIWIANTGQGSVSKVDTRTYTEVARYYTGPRMGSGDDPSRTSVNTFGDVYVANRGGGNSGGRSVTKISTRGEECPDTNGDGVITTSSGPDDLLEWGQDDCVLWNTTVDDGGRLRAIAAHDVRGEDGSITPYVWVGGWSSIGWKLDGETGDIILRTETPANNYGFALDGRGNLWIAGRGTSGGSLGRIDTALCFDQESCNVETCMGEGPDQDACAKQRIQLNHNPYGITVDFNQTVWIGNNTNNGAITRYIHSAPAGERITDISGLPSVFGITADDQGYIWGAAMGGGVTYLKADDLDVKGVVDDTTGLSMRGVAVDLDGKIWAINLNHDSATVLVPNPANIVESVNRTAVEDFVSPYTYSDMTGSQLRFATNESGTYRRIFDGCPAPIPTTDWGNLNWNAEVPEHTRLQLRLRAAYSRLGLPEATWHHVATVPPDMAPINIAPILDNIGMSDALVVEIEVELHSYRSESLEFFAPRLLELGLDFSCMQILD